MASAEAAIGFWNHRGLLTSWQVCPKTDVYRERVDEDVLKDTVNSLTLLHVKLRQTQLWSEFAIIKRIIYKHGNQHRKQFYFHGLRRIVKNLNRLQEIGISKKLADVRNSFPSLPKHGLMTETPPNYPSIGLIVNILGCLTGAAQIILQVSSFCQETFKFSCSELASGFFLTFHLTLVSSLSRVWVFLKDFLYAVAECYDIIFPWLNLLEDTQKIENSEAKDLPKSLRIWLEPLDNEDFNKKANSTSVTPAKTSTPGTLDKLFASTPRQKPEDTSPRFLPASADSLTEPSCDLGESFVPDDMNRPLQPSGAMIPDEISNLKKKLFPASPVELHKQDGEHVPRVNSSDSTRPKKRKATEFLDSELSNTPTKKLATELKRFLNRGGLCRHSCTTIHIFGNKTWKLSIERKLRKKLAQRVLKKKERGGEASRDATCTKKRKREISSRDNVFTKKKRIPTSKEETRAKKKAKKRTSRDATKIKKKREEEKSRDPTRVKKTRKEKPKKGEAHPKAKRKLKADKDDIPAKKKRKEEKRGDLTHAKKTRKEKPKKGETHRREKRKLRKTGKDDIPVKKKRKEETSSNPTNKKKKMKAESRKYPTKTNKKRREKTCKDETTTKKKRKEKCRKDKAKTKKKRNKASGKSKDKSGKHETQAKTKTNKKPCRDKTDSKKKRKLKIDKHETPKKKTKQKLDKMKHLKKRKKQQRRTLRRKVRKESE